MREVFRDMGLPLAIVVGITIAGLYAYLTDPHRHQVCAQWTDIRKN